MIFASVGSMLPFDRFTRAIDDWAQANPNVSVLLQIGDGAYEPQHAEWVRMLPHAVYAQYLADCDLFVAHVGIGSILQALEVGKQMLMLPRLASLGEHTTDHQLHTAARFDATPGLEIVDDVAALQSRMSALLDRPMSAGDGISPFAPPGMTAQIRTYLRDLATG